MRKILAVKPLDNYLLELKFDDHSTLFFDMRNYLEFPVFRVLKRIENFKAVVNKGYFVEWEKFDLELSADTLWHEGKSFSA